MPSIPFTHTGPDPEKLYAVVEGFSADLPSFPDFSPRIGTRLPGDHPAVVALFEAGYFAEVGGKDYIVVGAFCAAMPDGHNFAPMLGTRVPAGHPLAAKLAKAGLLVPADASDEQIRAAKAAVMAPALDRVPTADPTAPRVLDVPPERLVVSTCNLFTPSGWLPAGSIADSASEFVKANREHFVPVPRPVEQEEVEAN